MAGADAIARLRDPVGVLALLEPGHAAATRGTFINAHSPSTGNPAVIPSVAVAAGQRDPGGDLRHRASPGGRRCGRDAEARAATMPAPKATTTNLTRPRAGTSASPRPARGPRSARCSGSGLTSLRVSCRLRPASASTCAVSWRKSSARYSGHVYLRNHRVNGRLRWQYRVDVTKKKGKKTTHVRRGYRTGGTVS